MADAGKHPHSGSIVSDLKAMVPAMNTRRRTKVFAYGFVLAFIACTAFLAFSPSGNASSLRFNTLFTSSSNAPYRSQFNSLLSYFFPTSSSPVTPAQPHYPANHSEARAGPTGNRDAAPKVADLAGGKNQSVAVVGSVGNAVSVTNQTNKEVGSPKSAAPAKNGTKEEAGTKKDVVLAGKKGTASGAGLQAPPPPSNKTEKVVSSGGDGVIVNNQKNKTVDGITKDSGAKSSAEQKVIAGGDRLSNFTGSLVNGNGSSTSDGRKSNGGIDSMIGCDIFHGKWVRDDSYPLYPEGSCPHIDEPFDCFRNGRPDRDYQKLRWQPDGCNIPRLNAADMLERLRGKRLVFVGDSLNRNMWESLVCVLRHAVKDKKKVFEASGNRKFRTEGSYSFIFKDYGCTIEFFRSPFLVQEWEVPDNNGTKKETLRLDIVEKSASKYKNAYVIVFNTGHWWTHEKTSKGKDYYQEGNHIYSELNVADAFHKALNTWAKWVDSNVNPKKTHVFFRGYSASHFSGGQWNSGGQCDRETEPIKKEAYLSSYPPKMSILETVIKGMKTPVGYLNITRMTDYRKDAHPSIYRGHEEKAPDHIQDCSHWCLPGVPDSWNELLYAQLLIKQHQARH